MSMELLAAHEPPAAERARPAHLRAGMTGGEAFIEVARSCMTRVCTNAQRLREGRNPEVLHQLRVRLRRLRAAFTAFKLILPGEAANRLMAEIKWVGNELDSARDIDVFIEDASRLTKSRDSNEPVSKEFGERLRVTRTANYERALKAVDSKRFAKLLLDCAKWVETGSWQRSKDAGVVKLRDGDASALAAQALGQLSHQLRKKGKHLAALKPAARHRARIKAKKLRYAAEFFDKLFGKHAQKRRSKFIGALAELQDALGALNDLTVARRTARVAAGDNGTLAVRARQMMSVHDRNDSHLLAKAVRTYERWLRARPFWR
jgi:triphosphatase